MLPLYGVYVNDSILIELLVYSTNEVYSRNIILLSEDHFTNAISWFHIIRPWILLLYDVVIVILHVMI